MIMISDRDDDNACNKMMMIIMIMMMQSRQQQLLQLSSTLAQLSSFLFFPGIMRVEQDQRHESRVRVKHVRDC